MDSVYKWSSLGSSVTERWPVDAGLAVSEYKGHNVIWDQPLRGVVLIPSVLLIK